MKIAIALILFFIYSSNALFLKSLFEEWHEFKVKHSKNYDSENEERYRFMVYLHNRRMIAKHNRLYEQGLVTYEMGVNQFGDWTQEEFVEKMTCFNATRELDEDEFMSLEDESFADPVDVESLPKSIDWRQRGAVTPVKSQGPVCGSCWAFAATGALEGQVSLRLKRKGVSLSEQNLIDCSWKYGNKGCKNGNAVQAFRYVQDNRGLDTEQSYPYEAKNGKCRYKQKNRGVIGAGYKPLPPGNEAALQKAVANIGPVAVSIDSRFIKDYKDGVFKDSRCSAKIEHLDHAVLVVGYGTSEKGEDYWLVKNSWGTTWGKNGYIRMVRNKQNSCGIASFANYPLVK